MLGQVAYNSRHPMRWRLDGSSQIELEVSVGPVKSKDYFIGGDGEFRRQCHLYWSK
jgi:hypothetical protein